MNLQEAKAIVGPLRRCEVKRLAAHLADQARRSPLDRRRLAAARLILRAAAPWSPDTHALWGDGHRARAVEALKLGYLIASTRAQTEHHAFVDVWIAHVLPHAITW